MTYRPDNWDKVKKKAIAERGMLPPQTEFPIVIPNSLDWDILKAQLFESGADAMLKALCNDGVVMENYNPTNRTVIETATFLNQCKDGILVFIPDEKEK